MGVLQACLSNVLPPVGAPPVTVRRARPARCNSSTSKQLSCDKAAAPRALGEEWAVVQRAIAGDARAHEQIFARHTCRLYRTALALLHNKQDAEDAVQDGLCKAYSNLHSFQGRSSFSTWLTRIVINSALMILRKKRRYTETSLDEILESQSECLPRAAIEAYPDPEKISAANEIQALVEEHIGELADGMRTAFQLGGIEGLSAKESSQVLGISVSAFKGRMFWARRALVCALQRRLRLARTR